MKVGSYLLVENLDRLSREAAGEALELFLSIVNRGVIIVQLVPAVLEFKRPVDTMSLMFAIVELSRGHSESAVKSNRGREVWYRKQREAAAGTVVTNRLPTWIANTADTLVLNEHAPTVRRIFDLVIEGRGCREIAVALNAERVPVMGRTVVKGRPVIWYQSTVRKIVASRAAVGEYAREGHGEPVAGYYPAVVTEEVWQRARAALSRRTGIRGGRGQHVNLFSNLMTDAATGSTVSYRRQAQRNQCVIFPTATREDSALKWWSLQCDTFEQLVLSQLAELTAADVTGEQGTRRNGSRT